MGVKESGSTSIEQVELPAAAQARSSGAAALLPNAVEVVQDTTVVLEARLGEATLSIRQLLDLREGSVVELAAALDDPVDIVLNGKVIARGQLVAQGEQFGIQITEIKAPA
jgi:flagellar motor switch protein FliN/FliY